MRYWALGAVLAIIAAVSLLIGAARSLDGPSAAAPFLVVAGVALLAIFVVAAKISDLPPRPVRPKIDGMDPQPWRRAGATIAAALLSVGGVIGFISLYAFGQITGLIPFFHTLGVAMTFIALTLVVILTSGRIEGEGESH